MMRISTDTRPPEAASDAALRFVRKSQALLPLLLGLLLLALALALTGCGQGGLGGLFDRYAPGRQANSGRTSSAYDPNPLVTSEQDRLLQEYLNRVEAIQTTPPVGQGYRPRRVSIPILPNDIDTAAGIGPSGPFSANAATRPVEIPRTGEGPAPGILTPIAPMATAPPKPEPEPEPSDTSPPPADVVARQAAAAPGNEPAKEYSGDGEVLTENEFTGLIEPYRQMAEADPNNLDKQLQLRLILAAAGMREHALEPIAILSDAENRRVADLLMMIMALRDRPQLAPTPQEAAEQVEALERLMQKLQSMADLRIPRLELCRTVNGYGNFETFAKYDFTPGQPMVVYCEVKNFSVEDKGSGKFSTVLDLELGLYNNLGVLVKPVEKDTGIEDISANRRNDFFLTTVYYVPADITPGVYTLKATIRDPRVNKMATSSVDITVIDPTAISRRTN